jgi:hypothetical protein
LDFLTAIRDLTAIVLVLADEAANSSRLRKRQNSLEIQYTNRSNKIKNVDSQPHHLDCRVLLICKAYSGLNLIADRIYKPNMDF